MTDKKFGAITLEFFTPPGRDTDAEIFEDSDKLQEIADKIEDVVGSFLPNGWRIKIER